MSSRPPVVAGAERSLTVDDLVEVARRHSELASGDTCSRRVRPAWRHVEQIAGGDRCPFSAVDTGFGDSRRVRPDDIECAAGAIRAGAFQPASDRRSRD